jgi:hypothetical protein
VVGQVRGVGLTKSEVVSNKSNMWGRLSQSCGLPRSKIDHIRGVGVGQLRGVVSQVRGVVSVVRRVVSQVRCMVSQARGLVGQVGCEVSQVRGRSAKSEV